MSHARRMAPAGGWRWLRPVLVAFALCGAAPATALAGWSPPGPVGAGWQLRAAGTDALGNLTLWGGDNRRVRRFTWPVGASLPVATGEIAIPSSEVGSVWEANVRGDLLEVDTGAGRTVRGAVVDVGGAQTGFLERAPVTDHISETAAALGADGTAAVAWTTQRGIAGDEARAVYVRVRPPGGAFEPLTVIAAPGPVRVVDVDVDDQGRIEVVFAVWDSVSQHVVFHAERGLQESFSAPVRVASTPSGSPFPLAVVAGGPRRGRLIFTVGKRLDTDAVLLRTGAEAWGAPQRFERGSGLIDADAVVRLPDGGVAVAYERRSPNERPGPTAFARPARMVVRRAPVGGAFGAPETIARIPPHWTADEAVLRVNSSGGLLLSWQEGTHGGIVSDICEGSCHQRVVAAFAPPGQPFGPARIVSRLGTALPDVGSSFVAALSDAGRGLVAWQTGPADANSPQRPMAATGDQTADRPIRADRNRPRFSVVLTRRALRSAARGARLRARIRCNERCAVRVLFSSNFGDEDDEIGLSDLRVVVLERVGSRAATWRLSLGQRRVAQRLLKNPRAVLVAIAIDAAGNTAVADKPLE